MPESAHLASLGALDHGKHGSGLCARLQPRFLEALVRLPQQPPRMLPIALSSLGAKQAPVILTVCLYTATILCPSCSRLRLLAGRELFLNPNKLYANEA